jgi:hypothetical protein
MKNSIKELKNLEVLSTTQVVLVKGGNCGTPTDPRRCDDMGEENGNAYGYYKKMEDAQRHMD